MLNSSACSSGHASAPATAWDADRLHSWKEIASFFRREVRTVQLWEKSEGLPVRRQHHKKLGSVFAFRHELENWWTARSTRGSGALSTQAALKKIDTADAQLDTIQSTVPGRESTPHLSLETTGHAEEELAYHAYIMGLHFWKQQTRTGLTKALDYFQDAILMDPACAMAYAGLTDTYVSLSYNHFMPAREAMIAAQRAVEMALRLQPQSVNVRNAEINFHTNCHWDWKLAESSCQQIVDSGNASCRTLQLYAALMINCGRPVQAISLALDAHRLDPLSEITNTQVSFAYFYAGDYDNAISFMQRVVNLKPLFQVGHAVLGRAQAQRGNWDGAIESFERGLSHASDSTYLKALLAYGYAGRGEAQIASDLLREIEERRGDACFPAVDVSAVYAMLNQQNEALHYILKAYDLRDMKVAYIPHDPRFTPLRTLPRFHTPAPSPYTSAS